MSNKNRRNPKLDIRVEHPIADLKPLFSRRLLRFDSWHIFAGDAPVNIKNKVMHVLEKKKILLLG